MDFIYVVVLILFVFHVKISAECNNDDVDVVVLAGFNVSLNWTLQPTSPTSLPTATFRIYNSLGNEIAEFLTQKCNVKNDSSTSCNTDNGKDRLVVSLTIFNVTERLSGNYTLRPKAGFEETGNTSSKQLVVIGKPKIPKILEVQKPVLGRPFEVTCNSTHGQEFYISGWRINGTEITSVHNKYSHYFPSLNLSDNFSHLTCEVCLNETASNFSGVICKHNVCLDSDPYTVQVIYGPDNISLSRKESHFYLKEHEIFTIDCFARCYRNCTYQWNGHHTIESEKLNISFESRKAGQYTCYVTNQETNITSKSNPITLHHVKKADKRKEEIMRVTGMGLAGVAVLLVVIGFVLIIKRCKNASNKTDSKTPDETVLNIRTPTNGEISQGISRIQNRPLPVPNTLDTTSRRPYRPTYPNHKRKSRSLHNLLDSTQDSFYPLRGDLSLQLLHSPSNIMGRSYRKGTQEYNSIKERRFSNCEENRLGDISGLANGIKLKYLYAKVGKDKKTNRDEHNAGTQSESLNNLRHESFEQEPQENLYSTIDEDVLSVYDDAKNNSTNEDSNEEQMNTRHGESDYDYADLPVL